MLGLARASETTEAPLTVDHGDLPPTEVVGLSVGHRDHHIVSGEGWEGCGHRRLQDHDLFHCSHYEKCRAQKTYHPPGTALCSTNAARGTETLLREKNVSSTAVERHEKSDGGSLRRSP